MAFADARDGQTETDQQKPSGKSVKNCWQLRTVQTINKLQA